MNPLREEAPAVVRQLKELGFENIVMMTGDSKHNASTLGIGLLSTKKLI